MVPTGRKGRPSKNITPKDETDYRKQCLSLQKQLERSEEKIRKLAAELKAVASINDYHKLI